MDFGTTQCAKDGVGGLLLFSKTSKKLINLTFGSSGGLLGEKFDFISSGGREQCPTNFLPVSGGILIQSCYYSGAIQDIPFGIPFHVDSISKLKSRNLSSWFGYGKKDGVNYEKNMGGNEYLYNTSIFPFIGFIPQEVIMEYVDSVLYDHK